MAASQSLLYVFDACSLLDLVASRRFADIARETPARFVTSDITATEVRYVRRGGNGSDAREREAINLRTFQDAGHLTVLRLTTPVELTTFVDLARELDDGEAAAGALAVHQHGTLVTDDRLARRILGTRYPGVRLLTTSEVIKAWADGNGLDVRELAGLLRDVEERGRFRPGHHDPLCAWWDSIRSQH